MSDKPVKLDPEVIQNRIVERIFQGLQGRGVATAAAAGYTQSEGKNYGMYQRDGSERFSEIERIAREIAGEEAARILRENEQHDV